MSMKNTLNLIQTQGGRTIKQADKGSTLTFRLVDEKRNELPGLNGLIANIFLYDKDNNRRWNTTSRVSDSSISFNLPGNLVVGIYDIDVVVGAMVFPSDRGVKIEVVEGYAISASSKLATELIIDIDNYVKKNDLSPYAKTTDMETKLSQKVDKISGKGLSTNDYTNSDRAKVQAIPSNPKYTDTTYEALPLAEIDLMFNV